MDAATTPDAAATMLAEALGIPVSALRPLSREPLGEGTVSGFELQSGSAPAGLEAPAADALAAAELPEGTVAYIDTSRLPVLAETGFVQEGVARVWIHPADPHLPALAPAAFGEAAGVLLRRLGVTAPEAPQIVGYRPGRRAVLRVPTADGAVWVKVVRPRRIERVVAAHTRLREGGLPVPAVRGWSPDGLLVLAAAEGEPATAATWDPAGLVDAVDTLRDRLATVPIDWPARTSLADRLPWYIERLQALLPARRERLGGLARSITGLLASSAGSLVTIHGDLHLGQLFVTGDDLTGLIDVDTAGRGMPGEDAAAFIAHAVASALLTARQGGDDARVWALAAVAQERWVTDPHTNALTAVHLLGHALGAASAGDEPRADALLARAETVAAGTTATATTTAGATGAEPKSPLMAGFDEA